MKGKEKQYDITYLKTISNNDENFIKEMIQTFVKNTPVSFTDIQRYHSDKNFELLYKTVHRLIPTLAFVSSNERITEFERLEKLAFTKEDTEELKELIIELKTYCDLIIDQLKKDFNL